MFSSFPYRLVFYCSITAAEFLDKLQHRVGAVNGILNNSRLLITAYLDISSNSRRWCWRDETRQFWHDNDV